MDPEDNRINENSERIEDDNPDYEGDNYGEPQADDQNPPNPPDSPSDSEDDDFPEYANEFNKQLNQIVIFGIMAS